MKSLQTVIANPATSLLMNCPFREQRLPKHRGAVHFQHNPAAWGRLLEMTGIMRVRWRIALVRTRFLWVFVCLFVLYPAQPAPALKLHYSMNSIKVQGRPGQYFVRTIQVSLAENEPAGRIRVHAEEYWVSEDGRQSFYRKPGDPQAPARSCAKWVKVNPVEATLEPGDKLAIKVTVAIPLDARPGGYWCALSMDEVPDPLKSKRSTTGMVFVTSYSTGIFVHIPPVDLRATITAVDIGPQVATVKVRNDGNAAIGALGRIEFLPPGEGARPISVVIPRESVFPEPNRTRAIYVQLPDSEQLPSGRYLVRVIFDIGIDHYIGIQKEMDIDRGSVPVPEEEKK